MNHSFGGLYLSMLICQNKPKISIHIYVCIMSKHINYISDDSFRGVTNAIAVYLRTHSL